MKKILLSIALITAGFLNAQENWINIEQNGFTYGATFRFTETFQNKLYVAGDTTNSIFLYSSLNGNAGSFVEETGIKPVLQGINEMNLISATSNSNYLFLGSQTYYDTTGGAIGVTPQVYRFDGTSYLKHGTINYSTLPVNNVMASGNNPSISKMAFYSPTGSNDSIYAFVSTGNLNNVSVWKAPAGSITPIWINSTNFSAGSGINLIYDVKVWHKKLYIAVNSTIKGGMILRTADGANWDTVITALAMQATIGVLFNNNYFQSLEIFKDTLVAGLSNSKYVLWYTADSLATLQTWKSLIDTASYGSITNSWFAIPDMQVGNGKLWIQVNYSNQTPRTYFFYKNISGRDTLLRSSGSTGLESPQNYYPAYKMSYFNNSIYSTGYNFAGSKISNPNGRNSPNSPMGFFNKGNIWRFTTINPTANFIDSVAPGTGYCPMNTLYLVNKSTDAVSYHWYKNGLLYSYAKDTTYNPSFGGTEVFNLIAYNGTYQSIYKDSISKTVTINPSPNLDSLTASLYTICQGQPDTLKAYASGGTAPYTYIWSQAINIVGPASMLVEYLTTVSSPSPTIIGMQIMDANNCLSFNQINLNIYVNPSDSLSGIISDTLLNPVTQGKVYLFKLNPLNPSPGDTAGVYNLSANGVYDFPGLFYGNYIAKAEADTSNILYKTAIGTYYSNKTFPFQWDSAIVIQHYGCINGNNSGNNIKILQMPGTITGTGVITGEVTEGPGYGTRYGGGLISPMGAPLKGVDVKLGKNPGGSPAARTTTDTTGNFTFTNVPLGSYKIYIDIPNFGMDSVRAVTLTSGSPSSPNNNYYVDSNMVRVTPIGISAAAICAGDSIMLGGMYQTIAGTYIDTLQNQGHDSLVITTLSINPLPTLTVTTSSDTICNGSSALLNAIGNSTSYLWSANAGSVTTPTVSVSPTITTVYTVTGMLGACPLSQNLTVAVKSCIGIHYYSQQGLTLYPNPATDKLFVQSQKSGHLKLLNITGQIVLEQAINGGTNEINLSSLLAGAYQVSINCNGQITNTKVMVSR